ncbi:hypothetical protein TWF225_006927 [Orbilia oligospora]|uniref:Uncharacterized protein n=1 Tax=Orbilia oligospora TaxID=2813651 RepID=A0A8H2DWX4_ORBOL|nr:hypothetical protein TWF225_006927 [Orbilia oligospora]TGJ68555.1 hypothetical protein EYR41_007599 [Orbilia oligospora]
MRPNGLDQAGGGRELEEKIGNENNSFKRNGKKLTARLDPKAGHWSSIWWKNRGVSPKLASQPTAPKAPLNGRTIRDINGKLCGIDLHGDLDVPPLNKDTCRTICIKPAGIPPTASEVRPLSFEHSLSTASLELLATEKLATPCRLDSRRTISPLPTRLRQSSSAFSDKSSVYSVSTVHEAKEPISSNQKRSTPHLRINTGICTLDPSDNEYLETSNEYPQTPTADSRFAWDKETISYRGIICGIDRYGSSIYRDALSGELDYESGDSSETTKRDSVSTKATLQTLANTNPSTPSSYRSGCIAVKPLLKSPESLSGFSRPPTMLEMRNEFLRGLPDDDDELSTIASLRTRQLEKDIMSCLEGEPRYPYSTRRNSTRRIRYDGENGEGLNRIEDNSNYNSEEESANNGMIESWRSGVSHSNAQPQVAITNPSEFPTLQIPGYDRRRSSDEGTSNIGSSLIGVLEPQHTGLKRLSISRRRYDRRAGYEASEAGGPSVQNERDEQEIRNLKAEVEAARSKTLSFQTILQRTSQRFVDSQNQNEELQRQIADLRDHQKLLYDALTASNEHRESSPYISGDPEDSHNGEVLKGVTEMTYKDDVNDIIEENTRLKVQVKSLARELAGREEEVRLLIEEMGKERGIYRASERANAENRKDERKNQQAMTDKSASRMAEKLKWWRRFLLAP